jgi:hypothetical protein
MRVEGRCLLDPPRVRRCQADHCFTECDQIHAQFYGQPNLTTSVEVPRVYRACS